MGLVKTAQLTGLIALYVLLMASVPNVLQIIGHKLWAPVLTAPLFTPIASHAIPPTENALNVLSDMESLLLGTARFAQLCTRIALNV